MIESEIEIEFPLHPLVLELILNGKKACVSLNEQEEVQCQVLLESLDDDEKKCLKALIKLWKEKICDYDSPNILINRKHNQLNIISSTHS